MDNPANIRNMSVIAHGKQRQSNSGAREDR